MMTEVLSAAVLLGIGGSLHCAGMCGPLVLVVGAKKKMHLALYHLFRLLAYTLIGLLLGAISFQLEGWVGQRIGAWFSLSFALLILISAFFPVHEIKLLAPVRLRIQKLQTKVMFFPVRYRAAGMGFLTALLPCGLLYAAFLLALSTNSILLGGLSMTTFAIASSPALILGQELVRRYIDRLSPLGRRRMQQALSVVAVFFLFKMGMHNLAESAVEASCH